MKPIKSLTLKTALLIAVGALSLMPARVHAASAASINSDARASLSDLYTNNRKAREIGSKASAVLIFPSIRKAGFLVAIQRGEGALITHHGTIGYYETVAGSYGIQAGFQKFGYAMFFMNNQAMVHLHDQGGWELGSAPSLVVVDKGMSGSLSTTKLKKGIYAFFFNQSGLMGGLGLQGSKITEIHPY